MDLNLPLQIVLAGEPALRHPCQPVPGSVPTEFLDRLIASMHVTMAASLGVGLAANQVGVDARLLVLGDLAVPPPGVDQALFDRQQRLAFDPYAAVNPVLTPVQEAGQSTWFEGCLSVPDYSAAVQRWNEVLISATDESGRHFSRRVSGWQARILQHEVDHLDGILYLDRMLVRTFMRSTTFSARWRDLPMQQTLAAFVTGD